MPYVTSKVLEQMDLEMGNRICFGESREEVLKDIVKYVQNRYSDLGLTKAAKTYLANEYGVDIRTKEAAARSHRQSVINLYYKANIFDKGSDK